MTKCKQPDKETVRRWLRDGVELHRPPPDPKQIRRELGWGLIQVPEQTKHGR